VPRACEGRKPCSEARVEAGWEELLAEEEPLHGAGVPGRGALTGPGIGALCSVWNHWTFTASGCSQLNARLRGNFLS